MKVYILIDHSRWCSPVHGCYSCAVDAAEAKKKFLNTSVVDCLVNSSDEPCEHKYSSADLQMAASRMSAEQAHATRIAEGLRPAVL